MQEKKNLKKIQSNKSLFSTKNTCFSNQFSCCIQVTATIIKKKFHESRFFIKNKGMEIKIGLIKIRSKFVDNVLRCLTTLGIVFFVFFCPISFPILISRTDTVPPIPFGNAVWMHVDTYQKADQETLRNLGLFFRLQGINKVILLGKNINGTVPYPSHIALQSNQTDLMKQLVAQLQQQQIRVYFYFPVNTDPLWIRHHPEDVAYQMGSDSPTDIRPDPEKKLVNLTSQAYIQYISNLCTEAITLFSLDGIQLDYIRYRNGQYGFSESENKRALNRQIDLTRIQSLTYQTFVKPGDWKTLLQQYDQKDPDVLGWAKVREDIITEFVSAVKQSVKTKSNASIGVTLVSSGASADAYTAIHFGQKWERLSGLIDFATPMAYHGSEPNPGEYVSKICEGVLHKINPTCAVSIGLQAHATSTEKLQEVVRAVRDKQMTYTLFRVGTFAFSHMEMTPCSSDKIDLHISWLNGIENQSLTAVSIEKTGSALWQDSNKSPLKWSFSHPSQTGESDSMSVTLKTDWNQAADCCLPQLILHSVSSAVPTLQHASWQTTHILYNVSNQTCQVNDTTISPVFLKVLAGVTWVDLRSLPTALSLQVFRDGHTYSVWDKKNGMRIEYRSGFVQIHYRIASDWMESEQLTTTQEEGWLPAKAFFQFFRYKTAYHKAKKLVHFIRWESVLPSSVALSCQIPIQDDHLFLINDAVWIEWEEFFQTSFYSFAEQVHRFGRQVVLYVTDKDIQQIQPETVFFMMNSAMRRNCIPDDYLFWLNTPTSVPKQSGHRLLVLPVWDHNGEIPTHQRILYRWNTNQPFKSIISDRILWVQHANLPKPILSVLSEFYYHQDLVSTVNWQYKHRFEK